MLAGDIVINGTPGDDFIVIDPAPEFDPNAVRVSLNGSEIATFVPGNETIYIYGGNGNDQIDINGRGDAAGIVADGQGGENTYVVDLSNLHAANIEDNGNGHLIVKAADVDYWVINRDGQMDWIRYDPVYNDYPVYKRIEWTGIAQTTVYLSDANSIVRDERGDTEYIGGTGNDYYIITTPGVQIVDEQGSNFVVAYLYDPDHLNDLPPTDDRISLDPAADNAITVNLNESEFGLFRVSGELLVSVALGSDHVVINTVGSASVIINGHNGEHTYVANLAELRGQLSIGDSTGNGHLIVQASGDADYLDKRDDTIDWWLRNDSPETETASPPLVHIQATGMNQTTIHLAAGDDLIIDPATDTEIFGDAGNDTIVIDATFGTGVVIDGGAGSDTYIIQDGNLDGPVTVADTGTAGTDVMSFVAGETSSQSTVQIVLVGGDGEQATTSLTPGNELSFSPETFTVTVPATNTEPVIIALPGDTELTVTPGDSTAIGVHVSANILPDSFNLDANGTLTVIVFGAIDFNVAQIDIGTVRFAGASVWQSSLVDANKDGRLDLQLKFRRQDTILDQIYADLLSDDQDFDGILNSTHQVAEIQVTGQTLDDALFSGTDSINLLLSGRSLRNFLDNLNLFR